MPERTTKPTTGAYLATPFAITTTLSVRGAVLAKLWAWYIVPLGWPALSWLNAIGITLVIAVVSRPNTSSSDKRTTGTSVVGGAVTTVALLLIALGLGAVVAALR